MIFIVGKAMTLNIISKDTIPKEFFINTKLANIKSNPSDGYAVYNSARQTLEGQKSYKYSKYPAQHISSRRFEKAGEFVQFYA